MKVLATDFDKTFFPDDIITLEENIQKMKIWRKKGYLFVIATGRNFPFLLIDLEKYNISFDYAICNDGGKIYNKDGKCLFSKDIPLKCNKQILSTVKKDPNTFDYFIDSGNGLIKDENILANAIIIKPIDISKAYLLLDKIVKENPEVHGYISDNWINITEKTVNKMTGLNNFLKMLAIDKKNLYTIGDNLNDYQMITTFNGAIMEEHDPSLDNLPNLKYKSVALYIEDILKKENTEI